MAESSDSGNAAPTISQGQTTSVAEGAQAVQEVTGEVQVEQRSSGIFENPLLWIVAALWIWYLFGNKKRKAQRAQEKKENERRKNIVRGDNIITIGRIHGEVIALNDDTVTIRPDPKAEYTMVLDRQAIFRVLPRPGEEEEVATGRK